MEKIQTGKKYNQTSSAQTKLWVRLVDDSQDWWLGHGGAEERVAKTEGHLALMAKVWVDVMMRGEGERTWRRLYRVDLGLCGDGHDQGRGVTAKLRGAGRE
ncbi:unnamed protein product [Sphenostylis stenocarpa]|uniref:Uncharacterized protein n=1 Tax=Sphenostylis stenocarpa TaxID=92480 RepID=A0AA86SSC3_9FABA|nr:unnamed protein product [Sphenostylis stenocarpa]